MPRPTADDAARANALPEGGLSHSEVAERLRELAAKATSAEGRIQLSHLAALFEKLAVQAARFNETYVLGAPKAD
jgi:hypothetical protein